MAGKCMGVTHLGFDFDGGSCMRFLERIGEIEGCIFGDASLKNSLQEGGISKLIFADASPKESFHSVDVLIYDHHRFPNESQEIKQDKKTAFDIMLESVGVHGFDQTKIDLWRALVKSGDQKSEADDMDIARVLKRVHVFFEDDKEAYKQWFAPLFDSFFDNQPDNNRAIKILYEALSQFVQNNPNSPSKIFFRRWLDRLQDKDKLLRSTSRNVTHFLAYLNEDAAKKFVQLLLQGYDKDQVAFQECKKDFNRSKIDFFGETLVIASITTSPKFAQVVKHMVYSKKEEAPPLIREKIKSRDDLWIVLVVNPKTKNFQIFINGDKKGGQEMVAELIKAVRSEIMIKRGVSVPSGDKLTEGGIVEGTEPLYFHKLETGYGSILWGSLKHPNKVPAVEFGSTSTQIYNKLVEIVKLAVDPNHYAEGCNQSKCQDCDIYLWQLQKCEDKRKLHAT